MRRGGVGLVAAVLALAGCKSAGLGLRPSDSKDKAPPGATTGRPKDKDKGLAWLDEALGKLPGGDTAVPKAGSWAHPKDAGFNPTAEGQGVLAGRVLDTYNQPAKSVFIRIESADARPGEKAAAGVYTDNAGYFFTNGLRPGQAYTLTVQASSEGRQLFATVQTRPPQPGLVLVLRDDLAPGAPPPAGGGAGLPPSATPPAPSRPPLPTPGLPPVGGLPPASDLIPPAGVAPPVPRPADGSWSPSGAARPGAVEVPPSLGPTGGPVVPPATTPLPAGAAPDRTAEGPTVPPRPPAASIPNTPAFPPLPVPPAPAPPPVVAPPGGPSGRLLSRPRGAQPANFTLVDALDRPWDFASSRHGSLVLLDFMTTTCVPCKRAVPTLVELQSRYAADGLQLVGVVCDDVPARERTALAARYQREHNLNYVLYTEPGAEPGAVRDRFFGPNDGYPTVVLLGADGTVRYKGHPGNRAALDAAIQQNLRR
jgi:thiol-disulfide isomerase/thioredoxin